MAMFRIIGPVSDDDATGDAFDQSSTEQNLAAMAGAGDQADRVAKAVCGGVELGSEPAFGAAKALGIRPPFSVRAPLAC